MTRTRIALSIIATLLVIVGGAAAYFVGPALLPPKSINVGIALNDKVPLDMALLDNAGKPTTLKQKMGKQGLVLVMVRSADWCPYCKIQLVNINDIQSEVTAQGYVLASLSYDKPEILGCFAKDKGLKYVLLSDVGSKMIDALNLRDPQYASDSFAYGVPRPTILIVGTDGAVKAKFVTDDYRSRPSNDTVLAMINGLKG